MPELEINYLLFIYNFWSSKPWIQTGTGIQPKMLDPDPESTNPDQKHCLLWYCTSTSGFATYRYR